MTTDATTLVVLLEVQDLDTAIAQAEHRKAALPERVALASTEASQAELDRRAAALGSEIAPLAVQRDELDRQADALAERRKAIEERMYSARGSAGRDLSAMDGEVHHLVERTTELEDRELEVMEALEPLELELGAVRTEVAASGDTLIEQRAAAGVAEAAVDAEIAALTERRRERVSAVPAALVEGYERLRTRLGGVGAARLVGDHCDGCHLTLPSAEVERIRHLGPDQVATCDQCGRILVVAPPRTAGDATGPSGPAGGPDDAG